MHDSIIERIGSAKYRFQPLQFPEFALMWEPQGRAEHARGWVKERRTELMFKRVGTLLVAGLIGVFVLAACGKEEDKVEPTVTRVPATGAPVLTPTTAAGEGTAPSGEGEATAAASEGTAVAESSPVAGEQAATPEAGEASPVAEVTTEASPVVATAEATTAASPAASPEAAASPAAAAPIEIDLADIKFIPNEITIPANTDVTINLVTTGVAGHDFVIDALGIKSKTMAQGESETITINAPAGTYDFYCSTPGHKEAGMTGKLIVQ
jgi:uncharacterized cupredoxin-like copper-binding protein